MYILRVRGLYTLHLVSEVGSDVIEELKDDLLSVMRGALEELDRRQLIRFEEFFRKCTPGKGPIVVVSDVCELPEQSRCGVEITPHGQDMVAVVGQKTGGLDGKEVLNAAEYPLLLPSLTKKKKQLNISKAYLTLHNELNVFEQEKTEDRDAKDVQDQIEHVPPTWEGRYQLKHALTWKQSCMGTSGTTAPASPFCIAVGTTQMSRTFQTTPRLATNLRPL